MLKYQVLLEALPSPEPGDELEEAVVKIGQKGL